MVLSSKQLNDKLQQEQRKRNELLRALAYRDVELKGAAMMWPLPFMHSMALIIIASAPLIVYKLRTEI